MTAPTRRILATSGGFVPTDRWGVAAPGGLIREALRLSGSQRPTVCLVMTAAGDDPAYLARSYAALSSLSCDVTHLALFPQPNADVEATIAAADVVWVGGGSVANLLALWRLHGVDTALRAAWERGAVLAGVSAGSICWHVGGTTDSFGPQLRAVTDALAFLPYGNGVHYDSEEQRRPLLHGLVGDGTLPTSYATDDGVGILYEGTEPVAVLSDRDAADPASGPAAYRVERVGAEVVETRLPVGPVG
ncbi:MAG: peptidase E [Candidatus Nanopelagicales bacterium]